MQNTNKYNNNQVKTYDNSPQAIRAEAIKRAKKEFTSVLNTFRGLGITPEQISDNAIRAQLVSVKEEFMVNARQKHVEDPFAQFEITTAPIAVTPIANVAPTAVVAPSFVVPEPTPVTEVAQPVAPVATVVAQTEVN